jgi:hypothetical protein
MLHDACFEAPSVRFTNITSGVLAEKGGSRTLREPYGPQTGFEDQRHHRAPSFSFCRVNWLTRIYIWVKEAATPRVRLSFHLFYQTIDETIVIELLYPMEIP